MLLAVAKFTSNSSGGLEFFIQPPWLDKGNIPLYIDYQCNDIATLKPLVDWLLKGS